MTLSPPDRRAWDGSNPTFPSRSSLVGLAFLLLLAGLDVELGRLPGRLLRLAGLGARRSKLLSGALGRRGDTTASIRVPTREESHPKHEDE
jgi:hypothetical protein